MVHISDLKTHFFKIFCKILRHFLGQSGYQNALLSFNTCIYLGQQVFYLPINGSYGNKGIKKPCRPYKLFHHPYCVLLFKGTRRGRNIYNLVHLWIKFVEIHWAIVKSGGETEAVFHKVFLSRSVAAVHTPHLRNGNMTFINKHKKILRKMVNQGKRCASLRTSRQYSWIVLYSLAGAYFP